MSINRQNFVFSLVAVLAAICLWSSQPALALVTIPANSTSAVKTIGTKTPAEPKWLTIPRLKVHAKVEQQGVDARGIMVSPIRGNQVAWFKYGPRPGQKGNAVISGHLNSPRGPEVFWNLKKMRVGDKLSVTDVKGLNRTFRVTKVRTYPYATAPLAEILGPTSKTRLNLVTCMGIWNAARRNYSHRLIVYTEEVPNSTKPTGAADLPRLATAPTPKPEAAVVTNR